MRRSGPLFATVFLFNLVFGTAHWVLEPTLRSWVLCGAAAGRLGGFSGSAACGDAELVVQRAAREAGKLHALEGLLAFFAVPVMGAVSDQRGRLPVLRVCMAGHAVAYGVIATSGGDRAILIGAFALKGVTGAFSATFLAILGDQGGDTSLSFSTKILIGHVAQAFGWAASIWILRLNLLDYTKIWYTLTGMFLVGCIVATQIAESLPGVPAQTISLRVVLEPVELLRDHFLRKFFASQFALILGVVAFFLLRSFVLTAYGWHQGSFELLLGFAGVFGCLSVACAPALVRRWSAERVLQRSALLGVIALTVLCLAPLGPAFCVVPVLFGPFALCGAVVSISLIAEHYPENQGKVQALSIGVMKASACIGHLLYSRLFWANAEGIAQARPFLVATVLGWLGYAGLSSALANVPQLDYQPLISACSP